MDQYKRRLAAAVYDRIFEGPRGPEDRAVFAGVELGERPACPRTILCALTLPGDPPELLTRAVAETFAILRVTWIALLRTGDGPDRRRIDAVHAALQCEVAAVEWAWSGGYCEGHTLGRTLTRRREQLRGALAAAPPAGAGLLVPRDARANEPLPGPLAAAWEAFTRAVSDVDGAGSERVRDDALAAIGTWRLGEMEATEAAAAVHDAIGGVTPMRSFAPVPAIAPEQPALRAAS
jgi:hypothetical protein